MSLFESKSMPLCLTTLARDSECASLRHVVVTSARNPAASLDLCAPTHALQMRHTAAVGCSCRMATAADHSVLGCCSENSRFQCSSVYVCVVDVSDDPTGVQLGTNVLSK